MTDRIHSLTVILRKDVRDDDIEGLTTALRQLRGVIDVQANVRDITLATASARARWSIIDELQKLEAVMRIKELGT